MDYRCPLCQADLGRRKLTQAIVTSMDSDCPRCKSALRLNVHPAEFAVVLFSFGFLVVLAALAYWFQSQALVLLTLGAAMLGALALPLLERIYLRSWPRYRPADNSPGR